MTYLVMASAAQRASVTWPWKRVKQLASIRREANTDATEELLALSAHTGVSVRPEGGGNQHPSEETILTYWKVYPGDLVFNPMWAIEGGVAVSGIRGAVSPAYRVYSFGPEILPRFAHYFFRSRDAVEQYRLLVRGVTTFDRSVTRDDLESMPVPVPPLDTQRAIADYLDAETARIDALIAKKQRMVELLEERRSVFVGRAVTIGLDDAATNLTSNEFAPFIREGWTLHRLRHLVKEIIDTAHKTAPVVDGGDYLVVRTTNVKSGELELEGARYTDEASWREWTVRGVPSPGDVIFTREAPAGEACLVPEGSALCIGQRTVLFRPDRSVIDGEWIVHSIYSGAAQRFIEVLAKSTTVAHINMSDIPDLPIVVPPPHEQKVALATIRREVARIKGLKEGIGKQIVLLRERRQALITAAVTGELNISEVAA